MPPFEEGPWPFADPPLRAVLAAEEIMEHRAPILYVARDEIGMWRFQNSATFPVRSLKVTTLRDIVNIDTTVISLANLPPRSCAIRESSRAEWVRS